MSVRKHRHDIDTPAADAAPLRAPAHSDSRTVYDDNNTLVKPTRPLILSRPDLQTIAQRVGHRSVTFFAWVMWLYVVVPLFSVLAWVAGATLVYEAMLQDLLTTELFDMLILYGSGAGTLAGTYLVWAITSYYRWRNIERRHPAIPVDDESLARSHYLEAYQLNALRDGQRTVVSPEMLEQMFPPTTEDGAAKT